MSALCLAEAAYDVQADIHQALINALEVQLLLGDPPRIYDDPPDQPTYPYLTYGDVRSTDTSGDDAPQSTHQISLHLWSRETGRAEVLENLRQIERTLEAEVSHRVFPLYLDVLRAPDGLTFHGLLRLSVTYSSTEHQGGAE